MAEKFLELNDAGLNQSQKKFCKLPENKNIRLLAPAGSGKTYSLLWRCNCISKMYEEKDKASNFLIITFTRSAKHELECRIRDNEQFGKLKMTVSTLNAWGWNYMKNRTGKELVVTTFERKALINHDLLSVCKKYKGIASLLTSKRNQVVNSTLLIDLIDLYKALGFTHLMKKSDYNNHIKYLKEIGVDALWKIEINKLLHNEKVNIMDKNEEKAAKWEFFCFWKDAVVQLEKNNRYTMEDQKYWPRIQLEEKMAEGKKAQVVSPYTHIFIDEFQDINPLDLALINAISKYHGKGKTISTTIVGDDDQAIFGWRGSTPEYILRPEDYFGQRFVTCVLNTNYRSPKAIVETSAKLIKHNKNRVDKEMKSAAKGKAILQVVAKKSGSANLDATIKLAHKLIEVKGCKNVALIGRKQATLFPYQVILSSEGTEYHVDADLDIYEGEAMNSLQSIVKIIYRAKEGDSDNPIEDLITVCDKVDKYKLSKPERDGLAEYLFKQQVDTFDEALTALKKYPDDIRRLQAKVFYDAVSKLLKAKTVEAFMKQILENFRGFEKSMEKAEDDTHYKNPQFYRLMELSKRYGSDLKKFNKDIEKAKATGERSRRRNADETSNGYEDNRKIKIHLLTATRSKGKEYDAVIILNADDGEWPTALSTDIEEERRLFYVAMTRAKRYLYFMVAEPKAASMFLSEAGVE